MVPDADEDSAVAKPFQASQKSQFAGIEGLLQGFQEQAPEQAGQNPDRQEEVRPTGDPSLTVGREAAAGHDTMQVRMKHASSVPNCEARRRSRSPLPGVPGRPRWWSGSRRWRETECRRPLSCSERRWRQSPREGEYDMKVGHIEKFGLTVLESNVPGRGTGILDNGGRGSY